MVAKKKKFGTPKSLSPQFEPIKCHTDGGKCVAQRNVLKINLFIINDTFQMESSKKINEMCVYASVK